MNAISIEGLCKSYRHTEALRNVSLEIPRGTVFGLLGHNGAGKTTLFNCMLGLARPTSGRIQYDDAPLSPKVLQRVSFVPETSALYEWMTVGQHFDMQRRWYRGYDDALARRLSDMLGLDPRQRVRKLSKGMRTAMAIALAFCTRPDYAILDEPTSGLDPFNQRAVLSYIVEAAANGCTVMLSSHQVGDIERAAEYVAILRMGHLLLDGAVDDLKLQYRTVEAVFEDAAAATARLAADPRVIKVESSGRVTRCFVRGDADAVASDLRAIGAVDVRASNVGVEELFFNLAEPERDGVRRMEAV